MSPHNITYLFTYLVVPIHECKAPCIRTDIHTHALVLLEGIVYIPAIVGSKWRPWLICIRIKLFYRGYTPILLLITSQQTATTFLSNLLTHANFWILSNTS